VELEAAASLRVFVMELVVSGAERLATLNAELARSNEELDAFAYVASHDLKEPLRGIHKYAHQLVEETALLEEEQRKKLGGVMRLTLRMDSLLDSLLHFSRVGRTAPAVELVDLNAVLAESVEMVGGRASGAEFVPVVPRLLPVSRCDRVRIREVFVNLLSNALKYNDKPEKRVEVGFLSPGEMLKLAGSPPEAEGQTVFYVRDNGIGIDSSYFNQVFKMFRRLHGREEYGGGAGAGLTIVKRVVERHGGLIWIESVPGMGSTFYFTLGMKEGA
jgi:light-regulated signal transduction histidine kinase (bacteriophytochrome)